MNLFENQQLMNDLNEKVDNHLLHNVRLFEKRKKNYKISIFIVETVTESHLSKHWLEISEAIAYNYQSEYLEKPIEIWNVYIFFLLKEQLSLDLKFNIENNKFSSRKFAMQHKNQPIDEIINNKLFSLSYKREKDISGEYVIGNIREFVKMQDEDLLIALSSEESKKDYISNLMMEETNGF